jgi:hypothetical protein
MIDLNQKNLDEGVCSGKSSLTSHVFSQLPVSCVFRPKKEETERKNSRVS